jgi:hypothetical protein
MVIKLSLSFFWQSVGTSHRAHRQAKAQCSALPTPPFIARRKDADPLHQGKLHPELEMIFLSQATENAGQRRSFPPLVDGET